MDFLSPTPIASSLFFLPDLGPSIIITPLPLPLNCCTLLAKQLLQLKCNTFQVKCNARPTLVPVPMNLNVAEGQHIVLQTGLKWNSQASKWWPLRLPGSHSISTCSPKLQAATAHPPVSPHTSKASSPSSLSLKPLLLIHYDNRTITRLLLSGMRFFLLTGCHATATNLLHIPLCSLQLLKMNRLGFSLISQPLKPWRQ